MNNDKLIKRFIRMFKCDTARIADYDTKFLILGWNRNTAKDRKENPNSGYYSRNGVCVGVRWPYDFDYVHERVVASGKTEKELVASAKEYKRLCGMTMDQYLKELVRDGRRRKGA